MDIIDDCLYLRLEKLYNLMENPSASFGEIENAKKFFTNLYSVDFDLIIYLHSYLL